MEREYDSVTQFKRLITLTLSTEYTNNLIKQEQFQYLASLGWCPRMLAMYCFTTLFCLKFLRTNCRQSVLVLLNPFILSSTGQCISCCLRYRSTYPSTNSNNELSYKTVSSHGSPNYDFRVSRAHHSPNQNTLKHSNYTAVQRSTL